MTTRTFLAVCAAPLVIVNVAVSSVPAAFTTMLLAVMPEPAVTEVAPVRSLPVMATPREVLCVPLVGVIAATVGPVTVNDPGSVAVPTGVVTLTFLVVSPAPAVIIQDALTVVAVGVPEIVQVKPPPLTLTAAAPFRLVPVRVIGTVVPRAPDVGLIDVSVGTDAEVTVNCTVLVVPIGVVTLTVLPVRAAPVPIVNVAVTVLSLTTVRPLTVMPPPDTLTAVAPVSAVPLSVTGRPWPAGRMSD